MAFGKLGAMGRGFGTMGVLGRAGNSGPSSYLGQVATRTFIPNTVNTSNKQIMSRTLHKARDDITSLQIVLPNFAVNFATLTETGPGASATVTASIEYPAGTFTQVKFSGSASGTISNSGMLTSDSVSVSIPNGATFFVRTWFNCASGIVFGLYSSSNAASTGDGAVFGVTTSDLTMSGSVTQATNVIGCAPVAIIAQTKKASVFLLGDSRVYGLQETGDSSGDLGELARSIGPTLAYINCGVASDKTNTFTASNTNRRALMAYCSHMIMEYGINDVNGGLSPATSLAGYQTIAGYFAGPKWACTLAPISTSTDSWATTANQTPMSNEANRQSLNASIRAGLANYTGFFEIADQVESARNSGKWKVDGTANKYTPDGAHETQFANLAIASSGAINPALFTR